MKDEIKDVIKKDKRFFGGEKMKSVRQIIRDMVDKYPNDMELGARVRWYIKWLYEGVTKKEYDDENKKWSI